MHYPQRSDTEGSNTIAGGRVRRKSIAHDRKKTDRFAAVGEFTEENLFELRRGRGTTRCAFRNRMQGQRENAGILQKTFLMKNRSDVTGGDDRSVSRRHLRAHHLARPRTASLQGA